MATPPIPFKVGEASPANTFFAIWMAQAAGLYEEYGLDFDIVKMIGGSDTGPALSEGRIQLMHIGMSSVVRANAAGFNTITIGSLSNVIRSTLFTAAGFTSADQIKGGAVGISSAGSESELTTVVALEKLGLARDDVTLKEIGTLRLPPLRAGEVVATMLGEPYRSEAFAAGEHAIIDLLADRIPWLYSGLVVDKPYLTSQTATRCCASCAPRWKAIISRSVIQRAPSRSWRVCSTSPTRKISTSPTTISRPTRR